MSNALATSSARTADTTAWQRASTPERLVQLLLALGCWTVLGLAFSLQPAADGLGTHEQLGLAPCSFYQLTGRPCPSCGMTTAFAHMAHAQPLQAVIVQPMGALLFILTAIVAVALTITSLTGRSWLHLAYQPTAPLWLYGLLALWLASWGYKIAYGQILGHFGP